MQYFWHMALKDFFCVKKIDFEAVSELLYSQIVSFWGFWGTKI